MDCWTILGLTPTGDERAVLRAYAQKLRETRPEDDPEGFQRLLAAREQALAWRERIPPPPPPADAAPPTIAIGQTEDQVTTAFGAPLKTAKVGVKKILYYKDMKVTLTNGKVSDVQ